jgi:hypothetical protein
VHGPVVVGVNVCLLTLFPLSQKQEIERIMLPL